MGDLSRTQVLLAPLALCAAMIAIALITAQMTGISSEGIYAAYFEVSAAITFVSVLVWVFVEVVRRAIARSDRPLETVLPRLCDLAPLLILPVIVAPFFLGAFTTAKTGLYFLVGFRWDRYWADFDRALFGADPWIYTHAVINPQLMHVWAWIYTVVWGLLLIFTKSFVVLFGERRFVATFFTAMLLTWLFGGWLFALCFSAAGPIFAELVDPTMGARFHGLRDALAATLAVDQAPRSTQAYLASVYQVPRVLRGGGISAMPSMHLGACSIYVIAGWRTRWIVPALIFWAIIFIGSVHFGYHYAVDGIVAAIIAALCWWGASQLYRRTAGTDAALVQQPSV